jgi:hypothetical protein
MTGDHNGIVDSHVDVYLNIFEPIIFLDIISRIRKIIHFHLEMNLFDLHRVYKDNQFLFLYVYIFA